MRRPSSPPDAGRAPDEPDARTGAARTVGEAGARERVPVLEEALRAQGSEEVIPIAEEVVRVDKRRVETGRLRVHTRVDVVAEPVHASLHTETVEVTRVPVDRPVERMPEVRTENGVTIVPVVEEVLFVEKRLILKEELHIRRNIHAENVEIPVELRKHRVEIERLPPADDGEAGQ